MLKRIYTSILLIASFFFIMFISNVWIFSITIAVICLLSFYEWIKNNFQLTIFGFLIIANFGFWSIFYIYLSSDLNQSSYFMYALIIANTAIFDTFAFLIGSNFGKTYIVKKISPNKTLEGIIGGIFASLFFGLIVGYVFDMFFIVLIFITASIFAFFGDLLVSYFKRQSGIKDTGNVLPGHGGVLDRIDSHLLATPISILALII